MIPSPRRQPLQPRVIELLESRIAPATVYAVEANTNVMVTYDTAQPGVFTSEVTITGIQPSEVISGLAYDQVNGLLLAVGTVDNGANRTARFYSIDRISGEATPYGAVAPNRLDTGSMGIDFSADDGTLRIIDSLNGHYGARAFGAVNFGTTAANDPNQAEAITGLASVRGYERGPTTVYGYNYQTDQLVTIGDIDQQPDAANTGLVKPVARVKINGANFTATASSIGFDISGPLGQPETAWIALRSGSTRLFTIDLATAALTEVGVIGDGSRMFGDFAVVYEDAPLSIAAKKATWTDVDGDLVTLTITKGTLTAANLRLLDAGQGSALADLRLDSTFAGTNISITAKPTAAGGDGFVDVGRIFAPSVDVGAVTVRGDLLSLEAGNVATPAVGLKSLTVRSMGDSSLPTALQDGSLLADGVGKIAIAGNLNASLAINGKVSSISIGGSVVGGDFYVHGISGNAAVGSVTVKGNLEGTSQSGSAALGFASAKSILIKGSLKGSTGQDSAGISLLSSTSVAKVTIGGSLLGGDGDFSARIFSFGTVSLKVGGDVVGGAGSFSGSISGVSANSLLKSATIGGSVKSGDNNFGIAFNRIGTLKIAGDVIGNESSPVLIAARAEGLPDTQKGAIAIQSITVNGNMTFTQIGAGYSLSFGNGTVDAAIGTITVGKNMVASSIVAGIDKTTGAFGDGDDKLIGNSRGSANVIAKIASIKIGGQLYGTPIAKPDSFGIEAEQIGSIQVGKVKLALTNSPDDLTTGFTADVRVREF